MTKEVRQQRNDHICHLYKEGHTQKAVSELAGVPINTVKRVLTLCGVETTYFRRFRNGFTAEQEKAIVEAYRDGIHTAEKLRTIYGVGINRINKILREAGFDISVKGIKNATHAGLRATLVADYHAGLMFNDLRIKYGIKYPALRIVMSMAGIDYQKDQKNRRYWDIERCQVIGRLAQTTSTDQLAKEHNCSLHLVNYAIRRGVGILKERNDLREEVLNAVAAGEGRKPMADRLGISFERTGKIIAAFLADGHEDNRYQIIVNNLARARLTLPSTTDILGTMFNRWQIGAASRGIAWELAIDHLQAQYIKQQGKCMYTGIKMICPRSYTELSTSRGNIRLMTLDRINSDLGYTADNICFCCYAANLAKNDWPDTEFRDFMLEAARNLTKETP